ncbi:THUMP domain-containing protein 1 like protein [Trachymyrmex septentrionalis]|uniref:THUMP domain-containing protein 1 like protein n=1 Tax=Trachymyrmex septentrionalis TaxID=34720 RepID=A0A151JYF6_9HYME|nr:PREDICTED: THUMP domain-containing protein 1 homolog [Trachymyrmex septentrionalis]KYN41472.1 THUMP domain-containing protein 1 like protein [Trachymyrmex septentrionalis]
MQTNSATNTRKRNDRYVANRKDSKKRKQFVLEPGMTGFLCTCNFHERDCITEAYRLLNLFADEKSEIHKESETSTNTLHKKETDKSIEDIDDDISVALEKEINKLRTEREMSLSSRKFQVVDTGVKNMIFITSTLPNPLELVTKIVSKLDTTKEQCTRYLLRLLPIEVVCKAYMDNIKTKANKLFEKYFAQEPKTFSIVFNRRSNNSIKRDEIIEDLAEIILKKNPGNKADLKNPDIAVIVEVIRGVCLFSIAPHYYKFKKYNLLEICNNTKNKIICKEENLANEKNTNIIVSNTKKRVKYTDNKNLDVLEEREQVN